MRAMLSKEKKERQKNSWISAAGKPNVEAASLPLSPEAGLDQRKRASLRRGMTEGNGNPLPP